MCRLAGIISYNNPPSERLIKLMRDSMAHGGPDDFGTYIDQDLPVAFGFRRLSFQDLSPLGHQPMMDGDKNIILIYNGEIYNFKEIRDELLRKNYRFISSSDSEVIIYAYLEWGRECFQKFNGMFAIALLDKRTNKILLARDHAGIKPLYYSLDGSQLIFASEIRAFKKIRPDWPENKDWKKYFLLFGSLPEPVTTLHNVQPLPKGSVLEIDLPSFQTTFHTFFSIGYNYSITTLEEAVSKIRTSLTKAVERHLISDAPIGLFLSGGIDSSLLTVLARHSIPDTLHTLSIIFENEKFSEKYYQDIIIKKTNARHRSFLVTEADFINSLPDILDAMDQPSSDGINSYFICKYAKEYGLKAALSGLGADELFGGYSSFNRTGTMNSLRMFPSFMFAVAGIFPDDKKRKFTFLKYNNGLGEFLVNRGFFSPAAVAELLDCSQIEVDLLLTGMAEGLSAATSRLLPTERVSYFERNMYMQNQLLKDTDYMSMWHGLEVRVPFLDRELIELVYSIHPDIRYSKVLPKRLLIDAFGDQLPEEIWKRPKQGFSFPFEEWMKGIKAKGSPEKSQRLSVGLANGNIHWSRYWTYVLSQQEAYSSK
ncbi:asparagine synthase (glutamine-hydrolyzing) [soil metagenome]